jgi:hypothetical protein
MPVVYDDRLEVFMMCKRVVLAVFLPALAMGTFAAQAQAQNQPSSKPMDGMGQMGGMSMEHSMDKPALPAGSLKITFWDKSAEWTPASLAALPHKTVTVVNEHTKAHQSYSGVPLIDLLTRLGVPDNPHGLGLKVYLVAVGADGYSGSPIAIHRNHYGRVAFSPRKSHLARTGSMHTNWRTALRQA